MIVLYDVPCLLSKVQAAVHIVFLHGELYSLNGDYKLSKIGELLISIARSCIRAVSKSGESYILLVNGKTIAVDFEAKDQCQCEVLDSQSSRLLLCNSIHSQLCKVVWMV
jgi:hypothetical protein